MMCLIKTNNIKLFFVLSNNSGNFVKKIDMGSYDNWKLDSPSENEVSECCGEDYDYAEDICMECGEECNVISRNEYIMNRYQYEY